MAALTIAGVDYEVLQDGAQEAPPRKTGEVEEMFSGRLRSTVRAENREWSFDLAPMPTATYNALRSSVAGGAEVQVTGDLLDGQTYTCIVELRGAQYIPIDGGLGFERLTSVTVREV